MSETKTAAKLAGDLVRPLDEILESLASIERLLRGPTRESSVAEAYVVARHAANELDEIVRDLKWERDR